MVSLEFGNSIPFHYPKRNVSRGLMLLPGRIELERDSQETWIPSESFVAPDDGTKVMNNSAGDSLTETWEVWGDPEHASFIEPGTYEFTSEIGVDPPGEDFDWTLSMTIGTDSPES